MSHPTSCENSHSVTFSQALGSGLTPCAGQDGPTIARSGQAPALASLSPRQARERDLTTIDTSGPLLPGTSRSASLSRSLASRLQAITLTNGSTLYNLTWKEWVTPSGLSRSRLRASVRRTSETERIGWPTPTAASVSGPGATGRQGGLNIQTAVTLAAWPTPTANVNNQPETKRGLENLAGAVKLAHWPTPIANDAQGSDYSTSRGEKILKLGGMVKLAGWVTPTARDWKDTAGMTAQREGKERLDQLPRQAYTCQPLRLTVFGVMQIGSTVVMETGGQLNPAHSRWLMGLPHEWDECSPDWQSWQAATAEAA